jgi:DNA-directed RNA polymerase II subunit RPB2
MFSNLCWDILDIYFQKGGSPESSNPLVKHQVDSYNKFIDNTLGQIIGGFNPIKVKITNQKAELPDNTYNISINILQPSIVKPNYQLPDGTQNIMTPYIARMNNMTYSSGIYVNVHISTEITNKNGMTEKFDKTVNGVYIGKIPIMVRSKLCVLSQMQGICEENKNECIYDFGGYFIVNGNEKVLISQDRINENKVLVFHPNNNAEGLYAEIRSMCDSTYLPPKTTCLNMSGKLNHMGRIIRINTSFIRSEVPIFVIFRALGVISDREIINHIVYDTDNEKNQRIINELMACCEDACDINTQEQAENTLIKIMIGVNKNNDHETNKAQLHNNLINDFIPHVGKSYRRKALYVGYIIRKMIRIYLGYDTYDNRDSYINKRVDTPGVLMSNLFRQCYGKMTKELKIAIEKELNLWRGNANIPISNIISDISIHRFFKQSLLDSWIRYSLSTGNWGIKSIGTFQNIKQGVSQVLNRMSYASTLSHLRRINTAMEKNGKLVQPRKLDNSQIGMICPAETPEGSSVGLVKNMALSTNISIAMNSIHIRRILVNLGVIVYDDTYTMSNPEKSPIEYLKNMGNEENIYIMVNGDIIGYYTNPAELYLKLKHYKRSGIIYPMTSIVWNIQKSCIIISTEAGRMYRPLYIVDIDPETNKRVLRIERILKRKNIGWKEYIADKHFDYFIVPNEVSKNKDDPDSYLDEEGFIEYMDCDEINFAMIATFPVDLEEGIKGTALPPFYTHCEIHPSLINGILGVNIPFSDHNQSPRNCYQCAMGKQALGVYMSNFNKRIDTMGNILNYPQKSLVYTKLSKYTMAHKLPSGVNAIVAIMTHTGFNQEDSIMVNQSALDRGLFTSTYYKAMRDVCNKNHSTGEEELFTNPTNISSQKPYSYEKLNDDGFVSKNTYVNGNDVIVGKVMPKKANGVITYQDSSLTMKANDDGYIDMNYNGINSDGYKFCKVRIRKNRKPEIGDKCASCSAQKGTIGMIYRHQDMPFTKDGIVPDIIMNPHAIPSRMTIAQLMESIMGKACCHIGAFGDSTPYTDCSVEGIAKVLEMSGMEKYGNEILYNGRTGEQIHTDIFIGPTYYQRLKHMVSDKIHCLTADHDVLTSDGWKSIEKITTEDKVAILKDDSRLVYEKPMEAHKYPEYSGVMYNISNSQIDLNTTGEHRMYVKRENTNNIHNINNNQGYALEKADDIIGKCVRYKKDCAWGVPDYQFMIPNSDKEINMEAWLLFFGKWISSGCDNKVLYQFGSHNDTEDTQNITEYLCNLYTDANTFRMPEWVWKLSSNQVKILMKSMIATGNNYSLHKYDNMFCTKYESLADDMMRLCIHAGWSGVKSIWKGLWKITIIKKKNNPYANVNDIRKEINHVEEAYNYEGAVYCISVSSEVFMVRRNGKSVWTGNSRGSNGPIVMLTRQPSEGRARSGGLRLGEMERDCFIAHGTSNFLAERMLHVSDNYRVFICKKCGMHANVNTEKSIYSCKYCKNNTDIAQVRMPYAFKLLNQELYTMNIMMRYVCN